MRSHLDFQSDRIEAVLTTHKIAARVTGGTVTPRWIRFQLLPAVGAKISRIRNLSEELAAALDASDCRISRQGAAVAVDVPRDDPQPVLLLPLLRELQEEAEIPRVTAVLGLCEDGAPLLLRLPSPDVAHVLVAGTTGSGKTALMQAMILSLALTNPALADTLSVKGRATGLALVLIDPKGHSFAPFASLPHLARPVVTRIEETEEALRSLVRLMERMDARAAERGGYGDAQIVVFIDELADVLMTGGKGVQQALARLVQRGREAGIHIVAATQKPTASILGPLMKANFPVRLVGRVTSASDARTASGWAQTGAERLTGHGDFLAVAEGRVLRFQAAYAQRDDVERVVRGLAARARRAVTPRIGRLEDGAAGRR
jgi:DNA segregation ATPase FtsK/SpoIIIE, S-DNA-T family